jgi:hypothetical protein
MRGASRPAISTPRISSLTFSPSPLGGSSSRSFASGLEWFKFPRRRHTRLKGRMTAISLVLIYLRYLFRVVGGCVSPYLYH